MYRLHDSTYIKLKNGKTGSWCWKQAKWLFGWELGIACVKKQNDENFLYLDLENVYTGAYIC